MWRVFKFNTTTSAKVNGMALKQFALCESLDKPSPFYATSTKQTFPNYPNIWRRLSISYVK